MKMHEIVENNAINTLKSINDNPVTQAASDVAYIANLTPAGAVADTIRDIGMTIIQGEPPEFVALKQRAQQSAAQQRSPVFFRMDVRAPGVFRLVKRAIGALGGDTRTYFTVQPNGQVEPVTAGQTKGLPEVT